MSKELFLYFLVFFDIVGVMRVAEHVYNISGIIAGIMVAVLLVGGITFGFNYFNNAKKDLMTNDIQIEVLQEGSGIGAKLGDTVVVNYKGSLVDGREFDNSYKRGQAFPVTIGEGRVIKGWEQGLQGIKVGEKRKLTIPPSMGYGSQDVGDGLIPPNSILIFEIEAVEIHPQA